jgi:hypothetical protein
VLLFPTGLAGLYQSRAKDLWKLLTRARQSAAPARETPSQVNLTPVEDPKHV